MIWHILLEIEPKWKNKSEIKQPLQTATIREWHTGLISWIFRDVGGWGVGGHVPPAPSFGISVDPIWTKGSRLCLPYYYWPLHLFGRCGVSVVFVRKIIPTILNFMILITGKWFFHIYRMKCQKCHPLLRNRSCKSLGHITILRTQGCIFWGPATQSCKGENRSKMSFDMW